MADFYFLESQKNVLGRSIIYYSFVARNKFSLSFHNSSLTVVTIRVNGTV